MVPAGIISSLISERQHCQRSKIKPGRKNKHMEFLCTRDARSISFIPSKITAHPLVYRKSGTFYSVPAKGMKECA